MPYPVSTVLTQYYHLYLYQSNHEARHAVFTLGVQIISQHLRTKSTIFCFTSLVLKWKTYILYGVMMQCCFTQLFQSSIIFALWIQNKPQTVLPPLTNTECVQSQRHLSLFFCLYIIYVIEYQDIQNFDKRHIFEFVTYGLVVAVHFSLIITNVETVSGLFFNLSIQHIIKLRITCFVST